MNRELSQAARSELEDLCTRYPGREAVLLPALRILEREFGGVDEPGLLEVARFLGVPPARVFGVYTFYHHFRPLPSGRYVLQVCSSLPCALQGSSGILCYLLQKTAGDPLFTIQKVECLAHCDAAPCLQVNGADIGRVTPEMIDAMLSEMRAGRWKAPEPLYAVPPNKYPPVLLRHVLEPGSDTLPHYLARGGYRTLKEVLQGGRSPEQIVELVCQSGLRGRGGAGFPTGQKWKFLPKDDRPRYLVVNGDESEPGTFKDRILIERDPHAILEGAAIAAYAIRAKAVYLYLRGEFETGYRILRKALEEAAAGGHLGPIPMTIHRGAGAYICGEETAQLSSLEGGRGYPKVRPPFPATRGLFRSPTIVNNVETITCVTWIVREGPDWFRSMGTPKSPGPKIFSVCGHVARPGCYEVPMGIPLRELIDELAGGIPGGRKLKAVTLGGLSAPALTAAQAESVRLDFESVAAAGSMLGSGGVIVMDETTCMVAALRNAMEFYSHESCGRCTPCRLGIRQMKMILNDLHAGHAREEDFALLKELAPSIRETSFCGLGQSAPQILLAALRNFPEDFESHLRGRGCPARRAGETLP